MKLYKEYAIFALLVLVAVGTRLLFNGMHLYNFNAVMATALFGGAYFTRSKASYAVPVVTLLLSDLVIGMYDWRQMLFVYAAFALTIVYGKYYSEKPGVGRLAFGVIGAGLNHFLLANFAVWFFGTMYAHNASGFVECYVASLPFYSNLMGGNVVFAALLFGSYAWLKARTPKTSLVQ